jgi:hypothetical protein
MMESLGIQHSPLIAVSVIITRKMRRARVSGTDGRHQRYTCRVSPANLNGVDYLRDLGVDKKIILKIGLKI